MHVSQKKHNFAAEYRVNWLHDRRIIAPAIHVRRVGKRERNKILVHIINISNFKKLIMDKKVLKMYEAPAVEIVEMDVEGQLLAGSTNADNVDVDPLEEE